MEKTNAEIIDEFNSIEELTEWLIEQHEDKMKTIQWEFYGGRNYEKNLKKDEEEIKAHHMKFNELTN
ncbi:hypothetical protein [Mammaliicoccus sciuri]|uniref:hypothetical protein n=1 Tax=Mammaliicoccus sciuri TaxID=1296 RepID=UPI001FB52629|nr:hypothetical protein [Mammaliicoccus sciuri]MCJ0969761.1 hypothetical protein [Mammaliicoccus sciuri]